MIVNETHNLALYIANKKKYNYAVAVLTAMRPDFEPNKFLSMYDEVHERYPMLIHKHVIETAIIIWKKYFVVPDKEVTFFYKELFKCHFNMMEALIQKN